MIDYQEFNSRTIDSWVASGWQWGMEISHETYMNAVGGEYSLFLTPTKPVPPSWLDGVRGRKVLALASGGGQQGPLLHALGAEVTVLDNSPAMLEKERLVQRREGISYELCRHDMTRPFPFADGTFDFIVNPVSFCYIRNLGPVLEECARVLAGSGRMLSGFDTALHYLVSFEDDTLLDERLPFDPLTYPEHREKCMRYDCGFQFSHTASETLSAFLSAGFVLKKMYGDTDQEGTFARLGAECFMALLAEKP